MKWYQHDSNAHADVKLKKLRHKYGITGYGLYWYCLELIAGKLDARNISFELEEDAEIIALEWNLDQLKVQEIMQYMVDLKLFESHAGRIFCMKLGKRLDDNTSRNPEIKRICSQLSGVMLAGNTPNTPETHRSNSGGTPETHGAEEIRLDKNRLDKKTKEKKDKPKFACPPEIPADRFREYLSMRTSMKKPASERAKDMAANAIVVAAAGSGMTTSEVIDVMLMKNWLSVDAEWLLKLKNRNPKQSSAETPAERGARLQREFNEKNGVVHEHE